MPYTTPGVYFEENSKFPPSVTQVETAIPAFIGFTEKAIDDNGQIVSSFPYTARINSFKEYKERFGGAANVYIDSGDANKSRIKITAGMLEVSTDTTNKKFKMYYALQMYFANGGGSCYICSVGKYDSADFTSMTQMNNGLTLIGKEDEPTILVFPDAQGLTGGFYDLYKNALSQSANLGDRVTIVDIQANGSENFGSLESDFRNKIGNNHLKYGMAYYPFLKTILNYQYDESTLNIKVDADIWVLKAKPIAPATNTIAAQENKSVFHKKNEFYHQIKRELSVQNVVLAPSSAMAGIYAMVDNLRGVWKAPANVSLNYVIELMVNIDEQDQRDMNIHITGKSVNAIRHFPGMGVMVWGTRTLAGNDNEWRYISVRRFSNMVEESVKKASIPFVFEPNDANTWVKVRTMIENFLTLQWKAGALAGANPKNAFYVRVGLGQTMTTDDILNGKMIVEIGMAVVRPAEFIILRFSQKMQKA